MRNDFWCLHGKTNLGTETPYFKKNVKDSRNTETQKHSRNTETQSCQSAKGTVPGSVWRWSAEKTSATARRLRHVCMMLRMPLLVAWLLLLPVLVAAGAGVGARYVP